MSRYGVLDPVMGCCKHPALLPLCFAIVAWPGDFAPGSIVSRHPWEQCWLFWGAGKRAKQWTVRDPGCSRLLAVDPAFDSRWTATQELSCLLFLSSFLRLFFFLFLFPNGHHFWMCLIVLNSMWGDLRRGGVSTTSRPVSCLGGSNLYTESWLHGVGF